MSDDDSKRIAELDFARIDVDAERAERIAQRARLDLGRGPSPWRFGEPVLVAILVAGVLGWAIVKVVELLR